MTFMSLNSVEVSGCDRPRSVSTVLNVNLRLRGRLNDSECGAAEIQRFLGGDVTMPQISPVGH